MQSSTVRVSYVHAYIKLQQSRQAIRPYCSHARPLTVITLRTTGDKAVLHAFSRLSSSLATEPGPARLQVHKRLIPAK